MEMMTANTMLKPSANLLSWHPLSSDYKSEDKVSTRQAGNKATGRSYLGVVDKRGNSEAKRASIQKSAGQKKSYCAMSERDKKTESRNRAKESMI